METLSISCRSLFVPFGIIFWKYAIIFKQAIKRLYFLTALK